jgi:AcrR family transcriptional regulator
MAPEVTDPIQEQLIAARRNQILDAATRVFAARGVHRATIREIAKDAGIADGTIYNYFTNKQALLLGILERANQSEQRQADFAQAADGDPGLFMQAYLAQRLARLANTGDEAFRVLFSELLIDAELRETYMQQVAGPTFALGDGQFADWAARGVITTRDPQLVTRAIASMVLGLTLLRALGDPYLHEHWADVPAVLADLLASGLQLDRGGHDA